MIHNYQFTYRDIILQPLKEDDIEDIRCLRNKQRQYFLNSSFITKKQQHEWFLSYLEKGDDIMFKISKAAKPNCLIGAIAVYNIFLASSEGEIGRTMIDKEIAPEKGLGQMATRAIAKFCFSELGLLKLTGIVKKNNERILKVDTRCGFQIIDELDDVFILRMTPEDLIE